MKENNPNLDNSHIAKSCMRKQKTLQTVRIPKVNLDHISDEEECDEGKVHIAPESLVLKK